MGTVWPEHAFKIEFVSVSYHPLLPLQIAIMSSLQNQTEFDGVWEIMGQKRPKTCFAVQA